MATTISVPRARRPSILKLASSPVPGSASRLLNPRRSVVLSVPPSLPLSVPTAMSPASGDLTTHKTGIQGSLSYVMATIVTLILFFVLLIAWLAIKVQGEEAFARRKPFCCPDEVKRLFKTINDSLDPCADFYLYTCFNNIRFNRTKELKMRDVYEGDIIQGVGSSKNSTAGMTLSGYYRSCLNGILDTDVLCGDMTTGIVDTFHLEEVMDLNKVTRFGIIMFGIYRINGILHWDVKGDITEIQVHYDAAKVLSVKRPGCLEQIVMAYNNFLKTSINASELLHFEDQQLPDPPSTSKTTESDVLLSTVFRFLEPEWLNLVQEVAITTSKVRHPGEMYLIDLFTVINNHQPLSVAYLITSFVYNSYIKATRDSDFARNMSGLEISRICQEELNRADNLWETVYAQAVTNPQRDDEFRSIFSDLIEAVSKIAAESSIFEGEDNDKVNATLLPLRLLIPPDLAIPSIQVPNLTDRKFGVNYFEVRNYETLMKKEKLLKNYPISPSNDYFEIVLTRYNFLRLSAGYYRASTNSASSKFLGMSVLGVRIARVMWNYLLTYDGWSDETLENIQNVQDCLKTNDNAVAGRNRTRKEGMALEYAFAIKSVLWAMRNASQWHTMKPAWGLIKMSNARLFYLLYMESMCNEAGRNHTEADLVNLPLKHIPDFAVSFECPVKSAMVAAKEALQSCGNRTSL